MKVLIAHTRYRQYGGEDAVADHEAHLLEDAGLSVARCSPDSADLGLLPWRVVAGIAASPAFHMHGRRVMRGILSDSAIPAVAHFHNLTPMLGLGAVQEARRKGAATVLTLHNYRLSCLAGTHLHNGESCVRCRPGHFGPGIVRGCYRGSMPQSFVMARALSQHWKALTEGSTFDVVLVLTDFMRNWLAQCGVVDSLVLVKPNSVGSARSGYVESEERSGVLFAGRLSPEKGILELVRAWSPSNSKLTIVGDGPLRRQIEQYAGADVEVIGQVSPARARALMAVARVVAMPSLSEGLPISGLEALAEGATCVAFDRGAMSSWMCGREWSRLAAPGDFDGLVRAANQLCSEPVSTWHNRSVAARAEYRSRYSDECNVVALLDVYRRAIAIRNATVYRRIGADLESESGQARLGAGDFRES